MDRFGGECGRRERPGIARRMIGVATAAVALAAWFGQPAAAQPRHGAEDKAPLVLTQAQSRVSGLPAGYGERMNNNTLTVMTSAPGGGWLLLGHDIATVLDDGEEMRILPLVGRGGGQNVRDVRFLKGVDLGIVQLNVLTEMQRTNEIGRLDDKISYIAKLSNDEMHVVVRADSGINSLADLNGKRVNVHNAGSGTAMLAPSVFAKLGVQPILTNMPQADALLKMKSGEIAATILISGKPLSPYQRLAAGSGYRLLPIPYSRQLHSEFLPATLSSADYPNLIAAGQEVETIAVSTLLIAYNWPKNTDRYRRIANFVHRFFEHIEQFQKPPRHPKWREINLHASVPGWHRFPAAEEWLQHNSQAREIRQQFDRFLLARDGNARPQSHAEVEQMFREFMQWKDTRPRR